MSTSRRFHLSLPAELEAAIATYARGHGLGLGPAIRLLVGTALEPNSSRAIPDTAVLLASLVAAEHAVLMVASILPEGERRRRSLATAASEAAEERLAFLRDSGSDAVSVLS
jgi:hypothetical protein